MIPQIKVGIVGVGVLGQAMAQIFSEIGHIKVSLYDKFKPEIADPTAVKDADIVFVQVPTPVFENGRQDLTAVEDVCQVLDGHPGIVVLRSTLMPGATEMLAGKYKLNLVHNPEFLTERNSYDDFKKTKVVLLSGNPDHVAKIAHFFSFYMRVPKIMSHRNFAVSEMAKLIHNCFLAAKVGLSNEFFHACISMGIDWSAAREMAVAIGVIGESHMSVPGPDGKYGFGGMCFVKDTMATVKHFERRSHMPILSKVIEENKHNRPTAYNGDEATGIRKEKK